VLIAILAVVYIHYALIPYLQVLKKLPQRFLLFDDRLEIDNKVYPYNDILAIMLTAPELSVVDNENPLIARHILIMDSTVTFTEYALGSISVLYAGISTQDYQSLYDSLMRIIPKKTTCIYTPNPFF
jgi:hypothetical protein